ncbi:hypothetical protein GCM10017083_04500 [Thalassobaculum fulvum]|uniref:Uncharacterized protein n=1 Tax=Thalassobaculum fulvum TaxID=1633335 RepID=A0A918XPI5_9PROT|nr:hypothetical protein GCM10017083_04500 [Thalassobaculum fulvum]
MVIDIRRGITKLGVAALGVAAAEPPGSRVPEPLWACEAAADSSPRAITPATRVNLRE